MPSPFSRRGRPWNDEMQVSRHFERFIASKDAAGRSPNTLRQYRIAFRHFCHFLKTIGRRESLAAFVPEIFQDFCIYLAGAVDQNTANQRVASLSSFCSWLQAHGILQKHPLKIIDKPKQKRIIPDVLTLEEVERLATLPLPHDEAALRAILCYAGLRNDEVCGLDMRDVSPMAGEYGMLYVRRAKGGSGRAIPLSDPRLKDPLVSHLLALGPQAPEHPIFRGPATARIRDHRIRRLVAKWGKAIGRRGLYPHLLRHSFGTHWIELGGEPNALQDIMGHRSFNTTRRYIHLAQLKIGAEMARLATVRAKKLTSTIDNS